MSVYPRMLFRGEETCVVADDDAKAAALALGWETHPLPGEAPPPYVAYDDLDALSVAAALPVLEACVESATLRGWADHEAGSEKPRKGLLTALAARLDALTE